MDDVIGPLIIAASGLPALGIALWSGRDGSAHARGTGLRWALIALCMFVGALGLYLAAGNTGAMQAVAVVMVLAVNGILVSLLLHLRRGTAGASRK
ncbi:hypothetical protein [Pseudoxanthomonas mexicana]|uniref:hypothetical protein n=1 Tax=Pseudoxanthomonas mexicana TaxID=128785 RepID=UPI00398B2AC4